MQVTGHDENFWQLHKAQEALQVGAFDHVSGAVRLWSAGLNQVCSKIRVFFATALNIENRRSRRSVMSARTLRTAMATTMIRQALEKTSLIHRFTLTTETCITGLRRALAAETHI